MTAKAKEAKPLTLVRLTLAGSLLLASSYGLSFLPYHAPVRHFGLATQLRSMQTVLFVVGIPLLVSVGLIWYAHRSLANAILADAWTEAELAPARRWVESPVWLGMAGMFLLAWCGLLVVAWHLHLQTHASYVLIYTAYPLLWVKGLLRVPAPPQPSFDRREQRPLFSSHWGRPPAEDRAH